MSHPKPSVQSTFRVGYCNAPAGGRQSINGKRKPLFSLPRLSSLKGLFACVFMQIMVSHP